MESNKFDTEGILKELHFQTARSSGKGGQNVNKVSSKVILLFNVKKTAVLNDEQREMLYKKYPGRINKSGELHITSSKERSQVMNKRLVIRKFLDLLVNAFSPEVERIETEPTHSSKIKRKEAKVQQSEKKQLRKKFTYNIE